MSTQLSLLGGERKPVVAGVELGRPSRAVPYVLGSATGLALGLGIASAAVPVIAIAGGLSVLYVVGSFVYWFSRYRHFSNDNTDGVAALSRGDLATARDRFARWGRSRNVMIRAMARHNLGWTLLREGRLEEAIQLLEDTSRHLARPLERMALLPTTRIDIALCHALLGDLERAETWSAAAQEPMKCTPHISFRGMLALTCAIIDCRRDRAADARATIEQAWSEHEPSLSGDTLRLIRVMRAFACACVDAPRNEGLVDRLLVDLKPRYSGELVVLGTRWPAMATFLAARGLDR